MTWTEIRCALKLKRQVDMELFKKSQKFNDMNAESVRFPKSESSTFYSWSKQNVTKPSFRSDIIV